MVSNSEKLTCTDPVVILFLSGIFQLQEEFSFCFRTCLRFSFILKTPLSVSLVSFQQPGGNILLSFYELSIKSFIDQIYLQVYSCHRSFSEVHFHHLCLLPVFHALAVQVLFAVLPAVLQLQQILLAYLLFRFCLASD